MKAVCTAPKASSLIESLRDIGYSLVSALADIIDNSITAKAKTVNIYFEWKSQESAIAIVDDGFGMTARELSEAMRPGNVSPLEERDKKDLGRFGLGLKTASFSQCRRLTVLSRKGVNVSGCRWDLDYVSQKNQWLLQVLDSDEVQSVPFAEKMSAQGTLVLWEVLDRVLDQTDVTSSEANLYEKIDLTRRHLELVFHRYLKGEPGLNKVSITVNDDPLAAFDPFHSNHPATQILRQENILLNDERIFIQPYILPHHSKVTKKEYEYYAGEGGYLNNQGFYVYRNARLLISGTWFRLARKSELTKLARVRIDLPNNQDSLWNIDVKKSKASPPVVIKQRLRKTIDSITGNSSKIYTTRGRKTSDPNLVSVWERNASHGEIFYSINQKHPMLETFVSKLTVEQIKEFTDLLKLVESRFPIDAFYSDASYAPENLCQNRIAQDEIVELAGLLIDSHTKAGTSHEDIVNFFKKTDPFRDFQDVCIGLLKKEDVCCQ